MRGDGGVFARADLRDLLLFAFAVVVPDVCVAFVDFDALFCAFVVVRPAVLLALFLLDEPVFVAVDLFVLPVALL